MDLSGSSCDSFPCYGISMFKEVYGLMEFLHTKCGGRIENRTCTKCEKHWNWFSFMFTLREIRPIPAKYAKEKPRALKVKPGTTKYSKWGDRIPGVGAVASRLPSWPRWARILVTLAFVGGLLYLALWFWGCLPETLGL